MKVNPTILGLIALFAGLGDAVVPTWPSKLDELEDVMFLHTGYKSRGLAAHVTPCGFSEFGPGRQTSAEWLRLGFHDMATANAYREPAGGIDASIAFELNNGENVGTGFATSLTTLGTFMNKQLPMADMIALGVHTSVRACGGPSIPMRGGRIDATTNNDPGVPQTNDGVTVFRNRFFRMGFNNTDMVQMTACGHTLGGVHSANFPAIVLPGTAPNDYQLFDNTAAFDNSIATRYINGPDTDPLSTGPAAGSRSDKVVFGADANVTLIAMTNAATFNSICSAILQRMIEVKPTAVVLSDVISPYEVKPSVQLTVLAGGSAIRFAGEIRVRTTTGAATSVQIVYKSRTGGVGGTIVASSVGTANGFDDSFAFFAFSADLPAASSISTFTVIVTKASGSTTYDNNGLEFPIQDSVIFQAPQSCASGGSMTVTAAVRGGGAPSLVVTQKSARPNGITLPLLTDTTTVMTAGATVGEYTLYSSTVTIASADATTFSVTSGTLSDSFKKASSLAATCGTTSSSSSSSSATSTSSGSSSSSSSSTTTTTSSTSSTTTSSTPTPTHPATIGSYVFQGCYTEKPNGRALSDARYDNATMTMETCAASCGAYAYFGVEYGQECYCGNVLDVTSTLAPIGDCNFICPGNPLQYCGAGNRMELYKKPVQSSSTSSSATTTTTTTSSSTTTTSLSSTSVSSSFTTSTTASSSTTTTTTTTTSAAPTVHIVPSVGTYNYFGCWTDDIGQRALSPGYFPSNTLTIQGCVAACAGYKYAGAEYSQECFCADSFQADSHIAPDADCSMTCSGDQYQYCGGPNRLTVYVNNGTTGGSSSSSSTTTRSSTSSSLVSSSSSTTSSSATTSSSISRTTISTSSSGTSTSSRTTTTSSTSSSVVPSSSTTTTTTTSSSSVVPSSSSTTTTTTSSSSVVPSSSSTTTTTTSSSSPIPTGYYSDGCWSDTTANRVLTEGYHTDALMTPQLCGTLCNGFSIYGIEYGQECFCGNTLNPASTKTPLSDCSFDCPGDTTKKCGAGDRLNLYRLGVAASSSTTTTTTVSSTQSLSTTLSSTTTTLMSTTTTSSGPTSKPTIGSYKYHGCQTEADNNIRALSGGVFWNETAMTNEYCGEKCVGFKYYGTEYGRECYCGNSFSAGSVPAVESDCNFLCPGDSHEYCGAGNRLTVYELIVV